MNSPPLVIAFGFSNLAMLGWLAAAAAPLLIHLWSRHRFREAPWAAMQFLLAAMRKNARRLQLQQWLLLALRTLVIVLIVLAVAQPYGEQLVAGSPTGPAHKLIVLDASYSMAYRQGDTTNFERAKSLAAKLVRQTGPGDTFSVILMASPPKMLFDGQLADAEAIATHIESLAPTHTRADLQATLALARTAITSNEKSRTSTWRREIYFITDMQRTTWSETTVRSSSNEGGNSIQDLVAPLAQRAALSIIDVGQPELANVAISRFMAAETFVIANRDVALEVTLREFGGKPRADYTAELLVDDVPVAEQSVNIPANEEATVTFTHKFDAPGQHKLTVRAAADGLDIDNTRSLVVPVREEIRVLCVEGRDAAARYVADALSVSAGADSPIEPTVVSESGLADIDVTQFDAVFLCNVAQLTDSEAMRLGRYAAGGGGIVFFLGDRIIPESYNRLSLDDWRGAPTGPQQSNKQTPRQSSSSGPSAALLPARIAQIQTNTQFGLDPLDYKHEIVAPFRGQERAGLLTTPVSRYYKLELPPQRRDIKVAAALHGDPLIITAPLARGRTVVVATDASLTSVDQATGEPWTLWPTWPSFLPMIRELLAYSLSGQQTDWQRPVGATLSGSLPDELPLAAQSELQIVRPDGRVDPVSIHTASDDAHWSYAGTLLSGIYTLTGLPEYASRQFAVNIDTLESDLAKANASELPSEFAVRNSWQEGGSQAASVIAEATWHEQLLWGALAVMLLESFLAWQFGRGGA